MNENVTQSRWLNPAMIVAMIAVVLGLTGGAYAAKNMVGSKDIKKNAISSKHVAAGSLKGSDLKPNTVKGKHIDESTLDLRLGGYAPLDLQLSVGNNEVVDVFSGGGLTVRATCVINQAGDDIAQLTVETSVENAALDADATEADFDPGDGALALVETTTATGTPTVDNESDGIVAVPGGVELQSNDAWAGVNILGESGACSFGGQLMVKIPS